ncbi:hypothetical protein B0J14DRAFT_661933 [Halenospora varia]|nr:hypothetical protein B0J14DRAFT_661933 [Halenospora varia]
MPSKIEDPVNRPFTIPLVDFSKYLHGAPMEQDECIQTIMSGFTTSGFLYLTNSGISVEELDSVFAESKAYFDQPVSEKAKFPNDNPHVNRGYSGMGVEKVSNVFDPNGIDQLRKQEPDVKESLEIGSEPGHYPVKNDVNVWPSSLPGFKEKMSWFYKRCDDLHQDLLEAIALGLGIKKDFFRGIKNGDHVLRLLHYPSVEKSYMEKEGAVRIGSHTDYGTVTLLFQDGTGGLQVQYPDGNFYDVDPVPGAIVINCCDLLQIWTNDVLKSTHHRVRSPTKVPVTPDGKYAPRYSIAFFCHPDHDSTIDIIETCWDPLTNPKKYEPTVPGEWIANRLKISY